MIIAVLTLPWYISALLIAGLMIYFPVYVEGLFFAVLFDTLYAVHFQFPDILLISVTVFLGIVFFVRTYIRT